YAGSCRLHHAVAMLRQECRSLEMKRRATVLHCLFIAACTAGALAAPARAESFPERTVKLVVPYPISGPTDIRGTSRVTKTYKLIAQHAPPPISDTLAQMVA